MKIKLKTQISMLLYQPNDLFFLTRLYFFLGIFYSPYKTAHELQRQITPGQNWSVLRSVGTWHSKHHQAQCQDKAART